MPSSAEVKLMETVQLYRCLYDKHVAAYKHGKREKKNAWEAVAKEMELSVEECQRLYNVRRTAFARHLKKVRSTVRSGVGRDDLLPIAAEWQHMRWLICHIAHRKTHESVEEEARPEDECLRLLNETQQVDIMVEPDTEGKSFLHQAHYYQ
ncbi:uncharacterized protein LOC117116669 [Anneissia japonica]|uniref:uncharacterized protein LOC117116669 n=1 Tax=Anneissia japonica TaxID=1529436 RepID=UPI001425AB56|nr:uncharacterized protein LOC117116669 [Anneissia japonica]